METIRACSIWRALEVVGDVPVLLIMERAFLGCHRFEEFVAQTHLARSVVNSRLARLVEVGLFEKAPAGSGRRLAYRLTDKGRDLFPTALMILRWQHRWEPARRGYQVRLSHGTCGQAMEPVAACAACEGEINPRQVTWCPGPGLSQVVPDYSRRRKPTAAAVARRDGLAMVDSAIELFGDRWATLVVRACFTGIHRFDDIQRDTLMATNVLADRLDRLLGQGIVKPIQYSAHRERFEYHLTEKGRDLYPVLLALLKWGDAWFADEKGPPLLLTHQPCGQRLDLSARCSACGGALDLGNVAFAMGGERGRDDPA